MFVSTKNNPKGNSVAAIANRLSIDAIPERWRPDHIENYESEVRKRVETLVFGDIGLYRGVDKFDAENQLLYDGRSAFRVYKELFLNGSTDYYSLGFNSFGGVTLNPEEDDALPIFYRAMLRVLLDYVRKQRFRGKRLRLVGGTGGGPGFPMGGSIQLLKEQAEELNIWGTHAVAYSILAKIDKETPAGIAHPDLTVRGQSDLGERCYGLGLPACAALFNWGGSGTNDEEGDNRLNNQLFAANGPLTVRVNLSILLDGKIELTPEQREARGFSPDHVARFYDPWDISRRNAVESKLAKLADYDSYVRVNVDEDPETRGREVGEDLVKWHQLRLEAGLQQREDAAIRDALLGLEKRFRDLDSFRDLLTELADLKGKLVEDSKPDTDAQTQMGARLETLLRATPLDALLSGVTGEIQARHTHLF